MSRRLAGILTVLNLMLGIYWQQDNSASAQLEALPRSGYGLHLLPS